MGAFRLWSPPAIAAILSLVVGCNRHISPQDAKERLVGTYHVGSTSGTGCESQGVKSSTLVLRSDGTYDQRVEFAGGETAAALGQHWNYDGGVHFSNLRITATGELNKYAPETEASLIVEFHHPVVILLTPDSDCFYSQPK
jgi:hypothetical protein